MTQRQKEINALKSIGFSEQTAAALLFIAERFGGGEPAEPQKLVISLDLSVLGASSFTLYSGGDNPTAKPLKLKHGKTLLTLAPNDGAVIVAR